MNLNQIKTEVVNVILMMDENPSSWTKENYEPHFHRIKRLVIESNEWCEKTKHYREMICGYLFNVGNTYHESAMKLANTDGKLETAISITTEERERGRFRPLVPEPPDIDQLAEYLEDSVNLINWKMAHGVDVIGPAWWMDNPDKDKDSWTPAEMMWLNNRLPKSSGTLVDDGSGDVFRYVGKGSWDVDSYVIDPKGNEYLFGVFTPETDPGRFGAEVEDSFDIDLNRWFELYGEEEHPARMMCVVEGHKQTYNLQKTLVALDGTIINGTHVWKSLGRKTYKQEGPKNLFKCVPIA